MLMVAIIKALLSFASIGIFLIISCYEATKLMNSSLPRCSPPASRPLPKG